MKEFFRNIIPHTAQFIDIINTEEVQVKRVEHEIKRIADCAC
jgi:hypothetical protein